MTAYNNTHAVCVLFKLVSVEASTNKSFFLYFSVLRSISQPALSQLHFSKSRVGAAVVTPL